MREILFIAMLVAVTVVGEAQAAGGTTTFYVQLVRGTDTENPPGPRCKRIGHKLAERFGPVFTCKRYWEIKCEKVTVSSGKASRVQLGNGREAEIDLRSPKERAVTAIAEWQGGRSDGQPRSRRDDDHRGSRDKKSVWFIVVRRDKPGD